jgi:hypothetical protein
MAFILGPNIDIYEDTQKYFAVLCVEEIFRVTFLLMGEITLLMIFFASVIIDIIYVST